MHVLASPYWERIKMRSNALVCFVPLERQVKGEKCGYISKGNKRETALLLLCRCFLLSLRPRTLVVLGSELGAASSGQRVCGERNWGLALALALHAWWDEATVPSCVKLDVPGGEGNACSPGASV